MFIHSIEESHKHMMEMFKPHHHKAEHHEQPHAFGFFPTHKPEANIFQHQMPKSDPLADMMKMMMGPAPQPMPMPKNEMGFNLGMPVFEQPHFDMSHFKLF